MLLSNYIVAPSRTRLQIINLHSNYIVTWQAAKDLLDYCAEMCRCVYQGSSTTEMGYEYHLTYSSVLVAHCRGFQGPDLLPRYYVITM